MNSKRRIPASTHVRCWHNRILTAVLVITIGGLKTAGAAPIIVTNYLDSGAGSLRAAVSQANTTGGADTITFAAGIDGLITLTTGAMTISDNLTIEGPGALLLAISGNDSSRIFVVNNTVSLTLRDLTIRNGKSPAGTASSGGGLSSSGGILTLERCAVTQNAAVATTGASGGGISISSGSLTLTDCSLTGNSASAGTVASGSAIGCDSSTVSIQNCTVAGNSCTAGTLIEGAIKGTNAVITADHLTYAANTASAAFLNGIQLGSGTLNASSCLFASGSGPVFSSGTLHSVGHNLVNDSSSGWVNGVNGDIVGVDPKIGTLGFYGGQTQTVPLLADSPAIDAADPANPLTVDQRGFPIVGCGADIGAFEFQTAPDDDGDGVINCLDLCANTPSCAQVNVGGCPLDSDNDGVADGCDSCPGTLAGDPVDANGCSTADEDGDGVLNDADKCRGTPACAKTRVDSSGCSTDADGDGLFDGCDKCPGSNDLTDTDGDGIPDCLDPCPNVGDTDSDGVQDCKDLCPADPLKIAPGACGCGHIDADTDGDGNPDCLDPCPNIGDTDGDGVQDCQDGCPNDPQKLGPGMCGCGNSDTNTDGDGVADCLDTCPSDPLKTAPGACGCGVADVDSDGNGIPDCLESGSVKSPSCGRGLAPSILLMVSAFLALGRRRCSGA